MNVEKFTVLEAEELCGIAAHMTMSGWRDGAATADGFAWRRDGEVRTLTWDGRTWRTREAGRRSSG